MGFNLQRGLAFKAAVVFCLALLLAPAAPQAASFSESTATLHWHSLDITLDPTGSLLLTPVDGPEFEYWSSWCAVVYAENSRGTSLDDWGTDVEGSLPDSSARAHGWVDLNGEGPVLADEVRELGSRAVIDVPRDVTGPMGRRSPISPGIISLQERVRPGSRWGIPLHGT